MPLVKGIGNVRYTGADISATIVEDNRRKFGQVGMQAATRDSDAVRTNVVQGSVSELLGARVRPYGMFVKSIMISATHPSFAGAHGPENDGVE